MPEQKISILPTQQFGLILTNDVGEQFLGHISEDYKVENVSEFVNEQEFDLQPDEILVVEIFSIEDNSIPDQFGELSQSLHLKELEHISLFDEEGEIEEPISAFDMFVHNEEQFFDLTFSAINDILQQEVSLNV